MKILGILALSFFLFSGCSTLVKTPDYAVSKNDAESGWAKVLKNNVDQDGWVDFETIQKNPKDLNDYVSFVVKKGPSNSPEMFTNDQDKLAFYINSYNALSMFNIIDSGIPYTNSGLKKVKFFVLKKIPIAGKVMSLKDYEDDTIRKVGDPRIHFALNCMAVGCPKLKQKPYDGKNLNQELDNAARFFFLEERNLRFDHDKKIAYVTEILDFFPQDFLKKAPTLVDFINLYSSVKIPSDYKLKYISYDWKVINQKFKEQKRLN